MSTSPAMEIMYGEYCPICFSTAWRTKKILRLNGWRVCRKCYYAQANRRQLAFVVDIICLSVLQFFCAMAVGTLTSTPLTGPAFGLSPIEMVVLGLTYFLFALRDGVAGRSPGKLLARLRVVDATTLEPIGLRASFVRNSPILAIQGSAFVAMSLVPAVSVFVNLVGLILFLVMAYRLQRGSRWGDGLANTRVVRIALRHRLPFDSRGLYCQRCGYDLRGSVSGVCSECGTPISTRPADAPPVPPRMADARPISLRPTDAPPVPPSPVDAPPVPPPLPRGD